MHEQLLAEERHLAVAIFFVECDQVLEGSRRTGGGKPREVAIDPILELVEQHLLLGCVQLTVSGEVGGIDHHGARFLQRVDAAVQERIERAIALEEFARDAEAGAAQALGIESTGEIGGLAWCSGGSGVLGIDTGHDA